MLTHKIRYKPLLNKTVIVPSFDLFPEYKGTALLTLSDITTMEV